MRERPIVELAVRVLIHRLHEDLLVLSDVRKQRHTGAKLQVVGTSHDLIDRAILDRQE